MQPLDHLSHFQKRLKRTRLLLARQVTLFNRGSITQTDLEGIFELSFLQIFIAFENCSIELMKTNLMMDRGTTGKKRSLFVAANRPSAERLLLGTSGYFAIMPVEQMEKIARVYLKDGSPFTSLSTTQKTEIAKAYAIRNHIAHRSKESTKKFSKKILSSATLPRTSTAPGYYLRSMQTRAVSYFDHHVSELGGALRFLCVSS